MSLRCNTLCTDLKTLVLKNPHDLFDFAKITLLKFHGIKKKKKGTELKKNT